VFFWSVLRERKKERSEKVRKSVDLICDHIIYGKVYNMRTSNIQGGGAVNEIQLNHVMRHFGLNIPKDLLRLSPRPDRQNKSPKLLFYYSFL